MVDGFRILASDYYLPVEVIENNFLVESCGIDRTFLESKIGVRVRRKASNDETCSRMAELAARRLSIAIGNDLSEVDLLIVCTQNPDYRLPTTACIVHRQLALPSNCLAFDLNLGCSGFVASVMTAGNFIKTKQARQALVITTDKYTSLIDYRDKNTAALFGDAASATLLTACNAATGFIDFDTGTDGRGAMSLVAYNSGTVREPDKDSFLHMNGREVFKFALSAVPQSVNNLLSKNGLNVADIKYFIFHQANQYMLKEIGRTLGLADGQLVIDMENYGNTVSSTIPIAWCNLVQKRCITPGDRIVFCGFGVGLSWASALYVVP
jgi:3-oxoacyl-[acyl-carrier-protein] synthase-3